MTVSFWRVIQLRHKQTGLLWQHAGKQFTTSSESAPAGDECSKANCLPFWSTDTRIRSSARPTLLAAWRVLCCLLVFKAVHGWWHCTRLSERALLIKCRRHVLFVLDSLGSTRQFPPSMFQDHILVIAPLRLHVTARRLKEIDVLLLLQARSAVWWGLWPLAEDYSLREPVSPRPVICPPIRWQEASLRPMRILLQRQSVVSSYHVGQKKLHRFIFAIALSELHLIRHFWHTHTSINVLSSIYSIFFI